MNAAFIKINLIQMEKKQPNTPTKSKILEIMTNSGPAASKKRKQEGAEDTNPK